MAQKLFMIALSPTMTEGTIAKWKKAEGEAFSSGDLLCEVETDKASMDYEAPSSAVLLKIVVQAGKKAAVGETIAIIGKAGEDPGPLLLEAKAAFAPAAVVVPGMVPNSAPSPTSPNPQPASPVAPVQSPGAPAAYPPSSPLARKVALERQVDIRKLRGSGPAGRVTEKDVLAYAAAPAPTPEAANPGTAPFRTPSEIIPVAGKRAVIARRLSESFFSAPHYYLKKEILAENLYAARASANEGRASPISYNAIIVKLAAAALAAHPEINVFWRGEAIERRNVIDIGLAVALPDGLVTPVVRDCAVKGILQIESEFAALIEKARNRGLSQDEYEGAGFTVTNLGGFGIDEFTAIINPPASAILAVGAMVKKPVVGADGSIVAARSMTLTLGCDHRTIDGATGARFLADLAALMEDPFRALL
ncbi:MAG: dihydrolipoamide acetyltransferase family protein [Rectinemataceae bacterium]|nr:dihydrolipoamide acetyltransferase family protein [Rectinemataceae bacterium]